MARGSTGRTGGSGDASKKDTVDVTDSTDESGKDSAKTTSASKSGSKSSAKADTAKTDSAKTDSGKKDTATKDAAKVSAAKSAVRQAAKASAKSSGTKADASGSGGSRSRPGKSGSRPAGGSKSSGGGRPPKGGRGRSVVGNRRVPWLLILATIGVVVFAGVAIGYAVNEVNEAEAKEAAASASKDPNRIDGITEKGFPGGEHTTNDVSYGDTPPFGGAHDNEWADCSGTVYTEQIRNENAVHSLEHGAVWITYLPGTPQEEIDALAGKVEGRDYMMMSPYPGQATPISLQSWGFQLQVQSADDPRIDQFIHSTRLNPEFTPEDGASCSNPAFKESPRAPGDAPPATPGPTDGPVGETATPTAAAPPAG